MNLAQHLGGLLDTPVRAVTDLGASHAWTLHRADLADNRSVFVKASAEPTTVFAAEANGLRWLTTDALVPDVLAVDENLIALPWLADAGATVATAERLGRELAALHANSPQTYGAPWPGWIAELPLDNTASPGPWGSWYAEYRLAPYLPRAAPHLGPDGIRLLEQVIDRIDRLAGPPERPARIHGDLWSGNLIWTAERAVLIDPAAHGGHRETDLAVLALFGAPHLDRIRAAYHEFHPLAAGWRARIPLHQLHHLLIHVVLFGGSYRAQTLAAATAALAS